jgi:hypothetical protein
MAPSVLLYTILFTLDNVPCHKNKYIDIFITWFTFLIKSKSLNENDVVLVIIDKYTHQYLEGLKSFIEIVNNNYYRNNIKYVMQKQPKTVMEGCMWKYNVLDIKILKQFNKDIYLYTDTDVLINKSFKIITDQMIPNSICIHEEKTSANEINPILFSYFFEGIPQNEMEIFANLNVKGLNAGHFAFYGKSIMLEIFNKIIEYNKIKTNYETLEQPLFNRAIYNYYVIEKKINVLHTMNSLVSGYSIPVNFDSVLIDCCGDPGNDLEHYEKVINVLHFKYLVE